MSARSLVWRKDDAPSRRGGRTRDPRDVPEEPAARTPAPWAVTSAGQELLADAVSEAAQRGWQASLAPGHGLGAEPWDR